MQRVVPAPVGVPVTRVCPLQEPKEAMALEVLTSGAQPTPRAGPSWAPDLLDGHGASPVDPQIVPPASAELSIAFAGIRGLSALLLLQLNTPFAFIRLLVVWLPRG